MKELYVEVDVRNKQDENPDSSDKFSRIQELLFSPCRFKYILNCFFLLIILGNLAFAQTGSIDGTCSLPDTSDWSGITVSIDGQNISTVTNAAGSFTLTNIHAGPIKINAGKLYYANADTIVTLEADSTLTVGLSLTKSISDTFSGMSTSNLSTASTNEGNIGVPAKMIEPGDSGFSWQGIQQLKEASFMIGIDTTRVSDAARFILGMAQDNLDHDFQSLSGIVTLTSGGDSTVQVTAFDDSRANLPPGTPSRPLGVSIRQTTSTYGGPGNNGYLILQMNIHNNTRFTLSNLLAGWFVDWQVGGSPNANRGRIISVRQQIDSLNGGVPFPVEIAYQRASTASGPFMGLIPLSQSKFKAARIASIANEILPSAPNGGLSKANKYNYMNSRRSIYPNSDFGIEEDLCTIVSLGGFSDSNFTSSAFTLNGGGDLEVGFAFVGGSDSLEFITNALNAQRKWVSQGHSMIVLPGLWSIIKGWMLVSLPVIPPDLQKTILFPNATSSSFGYNFNKTYFQTDSMYPGQAYWLKFSRADYKEFEGNPLVEDTINVSAGWIMFGSLSSPVPVQNIVTNPASIITGDVYGYNHGYFIADTLQPFQGYWVKLTQGGQLILAAPGK
ncbi:MAG: hypothetical protein ACHQQQ_04865 [Bacteroidota bacterium]